MDLTWLSELEDVSPGALTVRAQALSINDQGRLVWDVFFPREDVDSTKLSELTTTDFRPAADRREWNQRGRLIPLKTPSIKDLEMVPIEAYFTVDELEMQRLNERLLGNAELIREQIGVSIPRRTDGLVTSDYRRIEVDVFNAWANGEIAARDPQTGRIVTTSFGFPAARYTTAATAWNGAVNAYDEFIAFLEAAQDEVGAIEGAVMRLATLNVIKADAPQPDAIELTRAQLQQRVQDELGTAFRIVTLENTVEVFNDGGTATTQTKIWPAQKVAVIPAGTMVGTTKFAPVSRAFEVSRAEPEAQIDVRGVTVYHETANGGRELTVEAQVNAFPVPDEQKLFVIDAGV